MARAYRALILSMVVSGVATVALAQQAASPPAAAAAKVVLPAGFTTQESTIGQTISYGDRTQYGGPKVEKSPGQRVLADFRGMTVYVYGGDKVSGKSTCVGQCLRDWQPVAAPLMVASQSSAVREWSVIRRDDGSPQWAYKGRPLYTFVKDVKAGDTKGEGRDGLWHAARP